MEWSTQCDERERGLLASRGILLHWTGVVMRRPEKTLHPRRMTAQLTTSHREQLSFAHQQMSFPFSSQRSQRAREKRKRWAGVCIAPYAYCISTPRLITMKKIQTQNHAHLRWVCSCVPKNLCRRGHTLRFHPRGSSPPLTAS